MAGLNANWNNAYAMDSLYGANPYATNSLMSPYASTMNDDFMAQSAFGNGFSQQQSLGYPSAFQGYQGLQQPTTDTFQSQAQGGGSWAPAVFALGAGSATAAGIYKWGANPIKDGKVDQNLINAFNKETVKKSKVANFESLYNAEAQKVYDAVGVKDAKQYEAIKKLSTVGSLNDLPPEIRSQIPASVTTPDSAKNIVKQVGPKLDKIDKNALKQTATRITNANSLDFYQNEVKKYEALQEKANGLGKKAKKEDLVKFIKENEGTFKLKGTEAQKTARAERLATRYSNQEGLLKFIETKINKRKAKINALNINLESQVKSHWDETAKAFKKDAPEVLAKAEKSFKLTKAGKWGALAAAGGLVLGWLFGNNA